MIRQILAILVLTIFLATVPAIVLADHGRHEVVVEKKEEKRQAEEQYELERLKVIDKLNDAKTGEIGDLRVLIPFWTLGAGVAVMRAEHMIESISAKENDLNDLNDLSENDLSYVERLKDAIDKISAAVEQLKSAETDEAVTQEQIKALVRDMGLQIKAIREVAHGYNRNRVINRLEDVLNKLKNHPGAAGVQNAINNIEAKLNGIKNTPKIAPEDLNAIKSDMQNIVRAGVVKLKPMKGKSIKDAMIPFATEKGKGQTPKNMPGNKLSPSSTPVDVEAEGSGTDSY